MNSIHPRREFRWVSVIGAAVLVISPLFGNLAHAVTITGSTFANELGGPPASNSYNQTNLSSVSASIRSDVTYSHAQSYASASVGAAGITKTTGGLAWVTVTSPTNLDDPRADLWNASATGTMIEAASNGNSGTPNFATFQFSLPASILASDNPLVSLPTDPTSMMLPVSGTGATQKVAQGVIANGLSNSLPTFYDVFVNVQANVVQNGNVVAPLFNGSYEFNPSTGVYSPSGDFMNNNLNNNSVHPKMTLQTSVTTMPQYSLVFDNDITGGSYDAPVGTPFTVDITTSMSMGDPGNPSDPSQMFDFSNSSSNGDVIGAGGSVSAAFLLTDRADFTVSAVPEPSALYLALVAGTGLTLLLLRRRSRSRA